MHRVRGAAALAGLVIVLSSCGRGGADGGSAASGQWAQEEAEQVRALAVEGMEVSAGSILQRVEGAGNVQGINEATIVAEVQGTITEVSFELGDYLEEGAILARVDDTVSRLSLEEARQALESARLDLSATERRFENGSASQAELSRARTVANGALARFEAAEEAFRNHAIRAPISGFVASRGENIGRGNYLTQGTPVARVVDLSALRLEIAVGERELGSIETGSAASVVVPVCGDEPIQATVTSIAAGADLRTGSCPVVIEWPNNCDRVRSGMSARVTIEAHRGADRLILPSAAIRDDPDGTYVYVVADNTVERRSIQLGDRLGERVEVLAGVRAGEIILVSGLSAVSDGSVVETSVIGRTAEVL